MVAQRKLKPAATPPARPDEAAFSEVVRLIEASKGRAIQTVNTALIEPKYAGKLASMSSPRPRSAQAA
jgi:hypothetical protein